MPLLSISDLKARYGQNEALKGISLAVDEGRMIAIIGSNGAGKTTLLRCISGLKHSSSGKIEYDGRDITGQKPHDIVKMGLVQVPEERRLFPYLSVLSNLKLGAYLCKDKTRVASKLEEVLRLFPVLKERTNLAAGRLSGGEQQMLSIGRGLMANPRLLMLDEPSFGLSPAMVDFLAETIKQINQSGVTVVLVEQNAYMALEMADTAYLVETGQVVLCGDSREVSCSDYVRKAYLGI